MDHSNPDPAWARQRRLWLASLLGAPLALRAAAPAPAPTPAAVPAAAASPAAAGADFRLTDAQGRLHSLAAHAGRWVLLNLWATWCTPCLAEMPELQALSRERPDLVVIGLAVDGLLDQKRMAQFAARLGVTYPLVAGDMEMASTFRARVLPTTLLYDPRGRPVYFKEGRVTRREIELALR